MRSLKMLIFIMGLLCAITVGSPMASRAVDYPDAGGVRVQVFPSDDSIVEIKDVDVRQEGSDLIVSGEISKKLLFTSQEGHIDVALVAPDGRVRSMGTAEYDVFPSRHRTSSFEVRFPSASLKGSELRLSLHPGTEAGGRHAQAVCMIAGKEFGYC